MINALSLDVEDYFQVPARLNRINETGRENYLSRIESNAYRVLELLNNSMIRTPLAEPQTPVRATFFCLGWIAKKIPQLIKEIHAQGHEVACLGFTHHLIYLLSKEEFRRDIRKAKGILEDLTGDEVIGYRAPCFSITQKSLWALKVLAEEGFQYDSSIIPVDHDSCGIPHAPRFPFMVAFNGNGSPEFKPLDSSKLSEYQASNPEHPFLINKPQHPKFELSSLLYLPKGNDPLLVNHTILEFPVSVLKLANRTFPVTFGGYSNRFPGLNFTKGLKKINEFEGQPFIFHLHPWELDFGQQQTSQLGMNLPFGFSRLFEQKEKQLRNIFEDFLFASIKDLLSSKIKCLQADELVPQKMDGVINSQFVQSKNAIMA